MNVFKHIGILVLFASIGCHAVEPGFVYRKITFNEMPDVAREFVGVKIPAESNILNIEECYFNDTLQWYVIFYTLKDSTERKILYAPSSRESKASHLNKLPDEASNL